MGTEPDFHDILRSLFGENYAPSTIHVASFPGDPHNKADAQWFGKRLGGQTVSRGLDPNNNNFVCMGLLDPQSSGRSLANVIGHTAFWMDDVGTKVPKARVDDWCKDHSLPPTLVTETSPGNYSYFWRFDAPVYRDLPLRANAVEAVRHRMKADGWGDPAAQDGARYMRLAGGVNGKKSYTDPFSGEPFRTRTVEWSPSNCVTVDAFAEAMLGPDWKTVAQSGEWLTSAQQLARLGGGGGSNERHASMDDPLVQLAAEIGLDPQPSTRAGVIDCHCPNEAAHTGGDPTGYAIINDGMSFCNHASCQHLRSPDFRDMMVERYDQMIAGGLLFGEYTDHPFSPGMVVRAADGETLPRDGDSFLARARFDKLDASSGGSVQEAVEQADGIASRQAAREQTRREQEQAAVEALADKLIHVDEAEAFWHREKHVLMTPSRLDRDEEVLKQFKLVGGDKRASTQLLNSLKIKHVDTLVQMPGQPEVVTLTGVSGSTVSAVNTYIPSRIGKRPGVPDKFLRHVNLLFGKQPEVEKYLIEALAWYVQNPGKRTSMILFLGGEPGIGKDFILQQLFKIVGEHNVTMTSASALLDSFNHYLLSQFIALGEFSLSGTVGRLAYDKLKDLTSPNPVPVTINQKYMKPLKTLVSPRFIVTSNDEGALEGVPPEDRRFFVAWSDVIRLHGAGHANAPLSDAYFADLWQTYSDPAEVEILHHYLATLPLTVFDPNMAPPRSAARHDTLVASLSTPARFLYDLVVGGDLGTRRVVSFNELEARALASDNRNVSSRVNQRALQDALRVAGGKPLGQYRLSNGKRVRLWSGSAGVPGAAMTEDERKAVLDLQPTELVQLYEDQLAKETDALLASEGVKV